MVLEVGIIGCGIAGLGAAIAQRKAGNRVEIFEKSKFKNEVGAAVSMTPDGCRVLDAWGFDHEKAGAVESQICQYVNGETLQVYQESRLHDLRKDFGFPLNHYHRVDLHSQLRSLALDPNSDGPVPELRLGCAVTEVNCEDGEIRLENGVVAKKDLIIGADGIHSFLPSLVTETDKTLYRSTMSAFRTLIPMEKILDDEELASVFRDKPPGFWAPVFGRTSVVTYPCRNNEVLNIAVLHHTLPGHENKTDWNSTATKEEVFQVLEGFNSKVEKLIAKADSFAVHKVMSRDMLETMVRGRVAVIGDAAHWMFPTHAHGAVCGVQEAAQLGVLMEGISAADVPKRLEMFNDIALDYAHVVQLLSNFGDRELAQKKSKKNLFPKGTMNFSKPTWDYFYDFDAVKEAREALAAAAAA